MEEKIYHPTKNNQNLPQTHHMKTKLCQKHDLNDHRFEGQFWRKWRIWRTNGIPDEEHCVQIWSQNSERALSYGRTKFWILKQVFRPKSAMHDHHFSTTPKGNNEKHCVQIWSPNSKKGLNYGRTKFWFLRSSFLAQNQPCMANIFWDPQKAVLLIMKSIVSKFEVPTPKGNWVTAGKSLEL